jgi:hypothetical protein
VTRIAGFGLHERIPVVLADFVRMLRKYGQEVLDGSPTAWIKNKGDTAKNHNHIGMVSIVSPASGWPLLRGEIHDTT